MPTKKPSQGQRIGPTHEFPNVLVAVVTMAQKVLQNLKPLCQEKRRLKDKQGKWSRKTNDGDKCIGNCLKKTNPGAWWAFVTRNSCDSKERLLPTGVTPL